MLFLKEKPSNVILAIKKMDKPMYVSEIARRAGVTYVYATHFLSILESIGLVSFSRRGKFKVVQLTEKGKNIAELIGALKEAEEQA